MRDKTQILLEQAYKTVLEASTSIQGPDQTPYEEGPDGILTSKYKTIDPRMGPGMGKKSSSGNQDQAEDSKLRYMLNAYLTNTLEREEFTQYNLPKIVDRIFEMLQAHIEKAHEAGRTRGEQEGLSMHRDLDAEYDELD
jgi:hypothetical protein